MTKLKIINNLNREISLNDTLQLTKIHTGIHNTDTSIDTQMQTYTEIKRAQGIV